MVVEPAAKGLTAGEVQVHLAEAHGAEVSRRAVSTVTDEWSLRAWPNGRTDFSIRRIVCTTECDRGIAQVRPGDGDGDGGGGGGWRSPERAGTCGGARVCPAGRGSGGYGLPGAGWFS